MKKSVIQHHGVVVGRSNGDLIVEFEAVSACGSCHAKHSCMVAETDQKRLTVNDDGDHEVGDKVFIVFEERQGLKAVILGYVLPFVLVFGALIIFSSIFSSEVTAGLLALAFLMPYYLALYIFRDKIKKNFTFRLQSTSS